MASILYHLEHLKIASVNETMSYDVDLNLDTHSTGINTLYSIYYETKSQDHTIDLKVEKNPYTNSSFSCYITVISVLIIALIIFNKYDLYSSYMNRGVHNNVRDSSLSLGGNVMYI